MQWVIPYSFVDLFPLLFRQSVQWIRVLRWAVGLRVCRGRGRRLLHLLVGFWVMEFALGGVS